MAVIICQTCDRTIEHFHGEKMATLYSSCTECKGKRKKK